MVEWALLGILVCGVAYLVYSGQQAKPTARATRGDQRLDAMYERLAAKKEADLQRLVRSGNDEALYARYPRDEVRAALQKYGGTTTGARAPDQPAGRSFEKYRASRQDTKWAARLNPAHHVRLAKLQKEHGTKNPDELLARMRTAGEVSSWEHAERLQEHDDRMAKRRMEDNVRRGARPDTKAGSVLVTGHKRDGKKVKSYRRRKAK